MLPRTPPPQVLGPQFQLVALPNEHRALLQLRVVTQSGRNQHATTAVELKIAGIPQHQSLKTLNGRVQRERLHVGFNSLPLGKA